MPSTWNDLLADVLTLTESVGATDVTAVAKIYLFRTLKYISRKADLDGLVGSASRLWQDTDTSALIAGTVDPGGTGFGITDFETPYLLMVGNDTATETPVPYHPLAYKDWLVLKGSAVDGRLGLDSVISDERPARAFTVNYSDAIELDPLPPDNSTVRLYYFKAPIPFGTGSHSPPLIDDYTDLLVDGAVLLTRAYIENPGGEKINTYKILSALDEPIMQMKLNTEGRGFRRSQIRISPAYSTKTGRIIRGTL